MSDRKHQALEVGMCEIYARVLFAIFGIVGLESSR
jgi:hypothetical protein